MKTPIEKIFPFKQIVHAAFAIKRVIVGTYELAVHNKPFTISITWTELGWGILLLCVWGLNEAGGGPNTTKFDRQFISKHRDARSALMRKYLPTGIGLEEAKRKLSELGFRPDDIGACNAFYTGDNKERLRSGARGLEKYLKEHNATSSHEFVRVFPRKKGAANVTLYVREDHGFNIVATKAPGAKFGSL